MTENAASSVLPYRLAAISLGIVAATLALVVLGYGFSDYDPSSPACFAALRNATNPNEMPPACNLPINWIVLAGVIVVGGLGYAAKVWPARKTGALSPPRGR
jgi:hypothetical protein